MSLPNVLLFCPQIVPSRAKRTPTLKKSGAVKMTHSASSSTFVLYFQEPEDYPTGERRTSPESYLFSYLRMLDTAGERLPAEFVKALQRVLAHYGVTTLDRSQALRRACDLLVLPAVEGTDSALFNCCSSD